MTNIKMMDTKWRERIVQGVETEVWIQDLKDFGWQKEDVLNWVSPERMQKAERLKNETAKKSVIGAEYLLNKVLAEKKREGKLPKEMEEWSFPFSYEKNTWGAPYFQGNPLYFNWSHSGDYVALAISDHPVGIDIQQRKKYKLSIAEKYFPEQLCEKLKLLEGMEQEKLFFRFWTLLEAWLKVKGTGFHKFALPDVTDAFSEEEGLLECGIIRDIPAKAKEGEEKQEEEMQGWKYRFFEGIEGFELCLVEQLR